MTCVLAYGYRGAICRIGTFDVADMVVWLFVRLRCGSNATTQDADHLARHISKERDNAENPDGSWHLRNGVCGWDMR